MGQEYSSSKVARFLTGVLISKRFFSLSSSQWKHHLDFVGFTKIKSLDADQIREFDLPFYFEDVDLFLDLGIVVKGESIPEIWPISFTNDYGVDVYSTFFSRNLKFFNFANEIEMDLSSQSLFKLTVTITRTCSLEFKFPPSEISEFNSPQRIGMSQNEFCYLKSYDNPNLKFSGPVRLQYSNYGKPLLKVFLESPFSYINYYDRSQWKKMSSAIIDLKTGDIK